MYIEEIKLSDKRAIHLFGDKIFVGDFWRFLTNVVGTNTLAIILCVFLAVI